MSNINLVSYAMLKKEPNPFVIKQQQIIVENAVMSTSKVMTDPEVGLLMLYGYRGLQEEISTRRHDAEAQNMSFHWIKVDAEINNYFNGVVNEDILPTVDFVNIKRLTMDVLDIIVDYFIKYGEPVNKNLSRVKQIACRPDLFERLCLEPEFKHISIFIIPLLDGPYVKQLAYVRPSTRIVKVKQDIARGISLSLPKWLPVQHRRIERTRKS